MLTCCQFLLCSSPEIFKQGDSGVAQPGSGFFRAQVLGLEIAVVETVEQEIHQIRHYSFCTLGFQQLNNMVICQRREFYQDLPYDADLWFLDVFMFQFNGKSRMIL